MTFCFSCQILMIIVGCTCNLSNLVCIFLIAFGFGVLTIGLSFLATKLGAILQVSHKSQSNCIKFKMTSSDVYMTLHTSLFKFINTKKCTYICLGLSCQPVNFEGFSGSNAFLCLNVILVLQQQQNCTLCSCNSSGSFKLCEFTCYILLFRERLSCNRGKAHMTNYVESYYGLLSEPQAVSAWWKETAQTCVFMLFPSLLLNHLEPQSSKASSLLPIIPIGTTFVKTAVLNCLIWPIQLLFYQCMFLCTHVTVCSTCFNCIQYSIQQKLSRYSISFSLSHCTWPFVLSYCIAASLNQDQLLRYVVMMSLFSFGSHFTVSLVLLVDQWWVHFALECSLGELIQG